MSMSFKYWEDCADQDDMEALWTDPDVCKEWEEAGESKGKKTHLSRDPEGQPFLTQTEMRAVAEVVVRRHFPSLLEPEMICAIAEIESDRQLLSLKYDKRAKEKKLGIMQMSEKTAEWIFREMGYQSYKIVENKDLLYRPFINIYFGAAYLIFLSDFDGVKRTEEFIVRAYRGGTKKATHKSTLDFFQRYQLVKRSLPSWREAQMLGDSSLTSSLDGKAESNASKADEDRTYWDSRVSLEDMDELWKNAEVLKDWIKSRERRGSVRFSHDSQKRPYLSRAEVKAVAEIIISRHFNQAGLRASALAALAEMCSMRFVNGVRKCTGLMGIDYRTALWLYNDVGYKAYEIKSNEDLNNPFVSMYFGTSYLAWLSMYEGRERTEQFVVEAYLGGPENVNPQEAGPLWSKFLGTLNLYEDTKKDPGGCIIL